MWQIQFDSLWLWIVTLAAGLVLSTRRFQSHLATVKRSLPSCWTHSWQEMQVVCLKAHCHSMSFNVIHYLRQCWVHCWQSDPRAKSKVAEMTELKWSYYRQKSKYQVSSLIAPSPIGGVVGVVEVIRCPPSGRKLGVDGLDPPSQDDEGSGCWSRSPSRSAKFKRLAWTKQAAWWALGGRLVGAWWPLGLWSRKQSRKEAALAAWRCLSFASCRGFESRETNSNWGIKRERGPWQALLVVHNVSIV